MLSNVDGLKDMYMLNMKHKNSQDHLTSLISLDLEFNENSRGQNYKHVANNITYTLILGKCSLNCTCASKLIWY